MSLIKTFSAGSLGLRCHFLSKFGPILPTIHQHIHGIRCSSSVSNYRYLSPYQLIVVAAKPEIFYLPDEVSPNPKVIFAQQLAIATASRAAYQLPSSLRATSMIFPWDRNAGVVQVSMNSVLITCHSCRPRQLGVMSRETMKEKDCLEHSLRTWLSRFLT